DALHLSLRFGASMLVVCIFATKAQADDAMRTFYGGGSPSYNTNQTYQGIRPNGVPMTPGSTSDTNQPAEGPHKSNWSTFGNHANQLLNRAGQYSGYTPGACGNSGHLPSAMPNPATMPLQNGPAEREAEHQRILNNMRHAGYSEDRIKAVDQYTQD